jgi:hypothetical protein
MGMRRFAKLRRSVWQGVSRRERHERSVHGFRASPSHEEGSRYLTADQIGVGRLRKSDTIEDEWILSSVGPAHYGTVSFDAENHADAEAR